MRREDLFGFCIDLHYCDHPSMVPGFHGNSCLTKDFTVMCGGSDPQKDLGGF